jgi:hypothetical protein
MGYLIDRAKERIGRVKADRATDMGIAGHKAAMEALAPNLVGMEKYRTDWKSRPEGQIEPNVVDRHKPSKDF